MSRAKERGMVSIIVVMFTSLLLIIISVSFLRFMVQEEEQASDNSLSQSAYDSAVSGVEDAKRVITACNNGSTDACAAIDAQACDTVQAARIAASTTDTTVTIRSNGMTDGIQGQAYTCVKIASKTSDVRYTLEEGASKVIPLKITTETGSLKVQWTLKGEDMPTLNAPSNTNASQLPQKDAWGSDTPAMLRIQVVSPQNGTLSQEDFDSSQVMTALLRPIGVSSSVSNNSVTMQQVRAANSDTNVTVSPAPISCSRVEFNANKYACTAMLNFGSYPIKSGSSIAYMRVTSLYTRTQFRLAAEDTSGTTVAQFDGVQPVVDSTGRAGDVYRRVSSRVSPDSDFAYPEYAVDITGSLCKDFSVTDTSVIQGSCKTQPSND